LIADGGIGTGRRPSVSALPAAPMPGEIGSKLDRPGSAKPPAADCHWGIATPQPVFAAACNRGIKVGTDRKAWNHLCVGPASIDDGTQNRLAPCASMGNAGALRTLREMQSVEVVVLRIPVSPMQRCTRKAEQSSHGQLSGWAG